MANNSIKKLEVKVRKMEEEDIDSVLEIDRKIKGSDRAATYTMAPTNYVGGELDISVVAEAENKIVGFLLGRITSSPYDDSKSYLIELIGVDPQYKRMGIGRILVEAFEKSCLEKGASSIRVMVSWHDWWLLSFLRSLDFSRG